MTQAWRKGQTTRLPCTLCDTVSSAKGLCSKHYAQARRKAGEVPLRVRPKKVRAPRPEPKPKPVKAHRFGDEKPIGYGRTSPSPFKSAPTAWSARDNGEYIPGSTRVGHWWGTFYALNVTQPLLHTYECRMNDLVFYVTIDVFNHPTVGDYVINPRTFHRIKASYHKACN